MISIEKKTRGTLLKRLKRLKVKVKANWKLEPKNYTFHNEAEAKLLNDILL